MIIVISPAKTLDLTTPLPTSRQSEARMLDQAEVLVECARGLSAAKLSKLMGISDKLAAENVQRYRDWSLPFTAENARPAIYTFKGDVYQGLEAYELTSAQLTWAQKHLRILSGLYGVLRPLDLIQPYRLEMGLPLSVRRKRNLYQFWGDSITDQLNQDLAAAKSDLVVNLASKEYFQSINLDRLEASVVTPVFKEERDGKLRVISFSAKRARGMMARFAVEQKLTDADGLASFKRDRYRHRKKDAKEGELLFTRRGPK